MKTKKWRDRVERLMRGITHPEEELSRAQRRVAIAWSAMRFAGQRLRQHRAPQLAAALAYRTIFSIIPLLVLALFGLRAVYGEEGIREVLSTTIEFLGFDALTAVPERAPGGVDAEVIDPNAVPVDGAAVAGGESSGEDGAAETDVALAVSEQIQNYVDRAVDQVRSIDGRPVAVIGVGVLVYSALSLLFQIESAFNTLLGATRKRRFLSRVTNYWTLVTIGALALFVMITIGNTTERQLEQLPDWLRWADKPVRLIAGIGAAWLLLLFAYVRIPTVRVHLRPAASGALVAAISFEVLKTVVTGFVSIAFAGQVAVYSSLALIPVTLLWVYLTWLIVLFGLEITHLLQATPTALRRAGLGGSFEPGAVVLDAGAVASVVAAAVRCFEKGERMTIGGVAERTGLDHDTLARLMDGMVDEGILLEVETSEGEARRYALAKPGNQITLDCTVRVARSLSCTPGGRAERGAADAVRRRSERALKEVRLADVAQRDVATDDDAQTEQDNGRTDG